MPSNRLSDLDLLVPAFRERLDLALADLAGRYLVWETRRSRERSLEMVAKGRSKARGGLSMHCLDLAADVICKVHFWSCAKHGCKFFEDYGAAVEAHGLVWGGNWDRDLRAGEAGEHDLPHCQAVPLRFQDRVRACPAAELDALCRRIFAGEVK